MSRITRDFFGGIPQSDAGSQFADGDWVYRCQSPGCGEVRRWRERPDHPQICPDHPDGVMACVHNPLGSF